VLPVICFAKRAAIKTKYFTLQIQPKWYLSTNFDYHVLFSTAFLGKNKIAIKAK